MISLPVWLPGSMSLLGLSVSGPMFLGGGGVCLGVSVQRVYVWGGLSFGGL